MQYPTVLQEETPMTLTAQIHTIPGIFFTEHRIGVVFAVFFFVVLWFCFVFWKIFIFNIFIIFEIII